MDLGEKNMEKVKKNPLYGKNSSTCTGTVRAVPVQVAFCFSVLISLLILAITYSFLIRLE